MVDDWVFTDEHYAHCAAAHAVVACLQGFRVLGLSLEPQRNGAAWIEVVQPTRRMSHGARDHRNRLARCSMLRSLLARPAALLHYSFGAASGDMGLRFPEILEHPMVSDAFSIAAQLADDPGPVVTTLYDEVAEVIDRLGVWTVITKIAEELLACRDVAGGHAIQIIQREVGPAERPVWVLPV